VGRESPHYDLGLSVGLTIAPFCISSAGGKRQWNIVWGDKKYEFLMMKDQIRNEGLGIRDDAFGAAAQNISSRAVAVSTYLFVESLYAQKRTRLIPDFVKFYVKLLDELKSNLKVLSGFREPTNRKILEEFQKYISQASVEPYAIERRRRLLEGAFEHYLDPKTRGEIIGGK
jgi:hypothetical protein